MPKVICAHDVVLGVFGTTEKASRVIGNKVYECMACARPTINEFCTGYPPEAKDCKAIKFVPPGDAKAIADAIKTGMPPVERVVCMTGERMKKPGNYIDAKGTLQLGVFNDAITLDCVVSEVKPWILNKQ